MPLKPGPGNSPSPFEIGHMMMSLWVPQAVHAAAELGLADALEDGPATAHELAERLETDPDASARLLDALAVIGLIIHDERGYSLTPLGEFLRSDSPSSRRAWARLMGGERVWRAWGRLSECVRTGEAAFAIAERRESETEAFDLLFDDPIAADVFHRAMADGTRSVGQSIAAALELDDVNRVVDVGGGYGELLCAVLERRPVARGVVFDLEHARSGALAWFERRGFAERAAFVAGDLFVESPPAGDLLLLKSVIHDWADDRALTVLERCREALDERSKLVVVEPASPAQALGAADPSFAWIMAFSDLNMLVNTGGRERSAAQYVALIERAGLRVVQTRPTGFYVCFICERAN